MLLFVLVIYIHICQCPNGHPICVECKKRINSRNTCPICREDLGTIRCLVLPQMAMSLEFPCRFKSLGCENVLPYETKLNHENNLCKFRPYNCPLPIEDCSVTGDIRSLLSHLKYDHMLDVYNGSFFRVMYRHLYLPRHTIVRKTIYIVALTVSMYIVDIVSNNAYICQ
jgi:E3 ubiquitin-protein ligase SIAH1